MRIAIVNWSSQIVGGAESYLSRIIVELLKIGHEVGLFCELNTSVDKARISTSSKLARWCVAELGKSTAIDSLKSWNARILFSQGMLSPELEKEVLSVAPAVFCAQSYYGTCISGGKTFKQPSRLAKHLAGAIRFSWSGARYALLCRSAKEKWRGLSYESYVSVLLTLFDEVIRENTETRNALNSEL